MNTGYSTSNELFSVAVFSSGPGKTSPEERIVVGKGGSVTVLFIPDSGCVVSAVFVDGMPTKDYDQRTDSFTFKNVTERHVIKVEFSQSS